MVFAIFQVYVGSGSELAKSWSRIQFLLIQIRNTEINSDL